MMKFGRSVSSAPRALGMGSAARPAPRAPKVLMESRREIIFMSCLLNAPVNPISIIELEAQLDLPRRIGLRTDDTKGRCAKALPWRCKNGCIGEVEHFPAELGSDRLVNRKRLEHREVPRTYPVGAQVWHRAGCVTECERRRLAEDTGVEPLCQSVGERAVSRQVRVVAVDIRPLGRGEGLAVVRGIEDDERYAG